MFAFNIYGPALKYRLDIMYDACPNVADKILIMTDKKSYPFYKDYHNIYEFVMVEDYKNQYAFSVEHELLPNVFTDEKDHIKNMKKFYNDKNKNYFYDVHRFIMPVMLDRNITKFFIIDSDVILINDKEKIEQFFHEMPEKSLFASFLGFDITSLKEKNKFWQQVKELTQINMELNIPYGSGLHPYYEPDKHFPLFEQNILAGLNDGWAKGFNFANIEDGKTFFNLWNAAIEVLCNNTVNYFSSNQSGPSETIILDRYGMDHRTIWGLEHVSSQLMAIFSRELNYNIVRDIVQSPGDMFNIKNKEIIGKHRPRVEDNLYYGNYNKRGAWYNNDFDYSKTETISDFIKMNKDELQKYYTLECGFSSVEVTDTHVYTRV